MDPINVRYARQNFRRLIDEVAEGGEVTLVRRGREVARLVGIDTEAKRLPALASFREGLCVKGAPVSEQVIRAREDERY